MKQQVKNSSGTIIGDIEITDDQIIINHYKKPLLIINDIQIIKGIKNKDNELIVKLYDDFQLSIGEIATLYGVTYSTMNKRIKKLPITTTVSYGRRNSSYGREFSEERKQKIGAKSKGRYIEPYIRTPEIKEKISKGLKRYYATHEVSIETREKLSQAWADGKYKDSKMGRGISGYFTSNKENKTFYFRSLLELNFLILIEEDNNVSTYTVEPFSIKLTDNHHYTPDLLINNQYIIELKPSKHLMYENEERWNKEITGATEFCNSHNFIFKVIYDTDIGFESRQYKIYLKTHPELIQKYNIKFNSDIKDWS